MGNEQSSGLPPEGHEVKTELAQKKEAARKQFIESHSKRTARTESEATESEAHAAYASKEIPIRSPDSTDAALACSQLLEDFQPRKQPLPKTTSKQLENRETSVDTRIAASRQKRPATTNAFTDDRRASLSSLPKIAKRTSVASPQSPERDPGQQLSDVDQERPPAWYRELKVKNARGKNEANVDTMLQSLRTQIANCQRLAANGNQAALETVFNIVREKLHIIVFEAVTAPLLKANRMLHDNDGLPQLFDERYSKGVHWPFDIMADARELYNKWCRRVFETDIMRGIKITIKSAEDKKNGQKTTDSLDPKYSVVSSKYHGNGNLLNGQWWPTQLCVLRDGAHGASIKGIYGKAGDGAYSCIMSGGHDYPDEDYGNEVLYCGTDSTNGSVTEDTRLMMESSTDGRPVRLIRSHNLGGRFAPVVGFRYDGLYDVVSYENLDGPLSTRQRHRFRLTRQAIQDPIRGGNGPDRRPTKQEHDQYKKHQRFAGKSKG